MTAQEPFCMGDDEKDPVVVVTPTAQGQIDSDTGLKEFIVKFSADAKNAMLAVQAGRYKDFGEAMAALGYEMERHDPEDDDE